MPFKYEHFGIQDLNSNICPECGGGPFNVDQVKQSWLCTACGYIGTLKVVGYAKSKELNVFSPGEIATNIDVLYEKGLERGLSTGWPYLDECFTVRQGELTIIHGIPSHGKSYFAEALIMNLAFLHKWRIALFSPEHRPHEMHLARFVQKFTGRGFAKTSNPRASLQMVKDTIDWMTNHFYFLAPPEYTHHAVEAAARAAIRLGKANALLIDPWNALEFQRPYGIDKHEYIGKVLQSFRKFAQDENIHVFIVAHPKKMERDFKTGKYPVPRPYDIAESALFYSVPDNILAAWREVDSSEEHIRNQIQVHVQKIKWESVGRIGMRELNWNPENGTFFDHTQSMNSTYPWDTEFGQKRRRR